MSTDTIGDVEVIVETNLAPYEDDGSNSENFTHIINPPNNTHIWRPGMSSQDVVDVARFRGLTVTALCGKTWVPKRNPEKHPACDTCMDVATMLMQGAGE